MRVIHLVWLALVLTPFLLIQIKPLYSPASYDPKTDTVIYRSEEARNNPVIGAHEAWHRGTRPVGLLILFLAGLTFVGLPVQMGWGWQAARWPWMAYLVLSTLDEFMAYLVTPLSLTVHLFYVVYLLVLFYLNARLWQHYWTDGALDAPWSSMGLWGVWRLARLGVLFWLI